MLMLREFSHRSKINAILEKKMRESRKIAPQNDPWVFKDVFIINKISYKMACIEKKQVTLFYKIKDIALVIKYVQYEHSDYSIGILIGNNTGKQTAEDFVFNLQSPTITMTEEGYVYNSYTVKPLFIQKYNGDGF